MSKLCNCDACILRRLVDAKNEQIKELEDENAKLKEEIKAKG